MKPGPLKSVACAVVSMFLLSGCTQLHGAYDSLRAVPKKFVTSDTETSIETPEVQLLIDQQRQRDELHRARRQAEARRMRRDRLEKTRALIALDLLDKSYQICIDKNDSLACTTFQSHWGELRGQLRRFVE